MYHFATGIEITGRDIPNVRQVIQVIIEENIRQLMREEISRELDLDNVVFEVDEVVVEETEE